MSTSRKHATPATDILEAEHSITILMDVPGATDETINVTLARGILTVRAEATPVELNGYEPVHTEFDAAAYERRFSLSDSIDASGINASIKDGVLRLTLPHKTPEQTHVHVQGA